MSLALVIVGVKTSPKSLMESWDSLGRYQGRVTREYVEETKATGWRNINDVCFCEKNGGWSPVLNRMDETKSDEGRKFGDSPVGSAVVLWPLA